MAAMDEIRELEAACIAGMPTITLSTEWQDAGQVLDRHGYVKQASSEDVDQIVYIYTKVSSTEEERIAEVVYPDEVPPPQYEGGTRAKGRAAVLRDFSIDTSKQTDKVMVNAGGKKQMLGIQMLVRPSFQEEDGFVDIRLSVLKLVVGVYPDQFLNDKQHLGFYPHLVQVEMQPLDTNSSDGSPLPLYVDRAATTPDPELPRRREASSTKVGGPVKLGFGPASVEMPLVEQAWTSEQEIREVLHEVVPQPNPLGENGDAAKFQWQILRWADGTKYDHKKPERKLDLFKTRKLPFEGAATLNFKQDAVWRYQRGELPKKFQLTVQVWLHLLMFKSGRFWIAAEPSKADVKYTNIWELKGKLPTG